MPIYEYKAFTTGGASKSGVIDADTERDARAKLRGQPAGHQADARQVSRAKGRAGGKSSVTERSPRAPRPGAGG